MKCLLIDKTPSEAYVELPDGTIVSIPSSDVSNSSAGDHILLSMDNLTNLSQNPSLYATKMFDFF